MTAPPVVRTLLGDVPATDFDLVSPHEHVLANSSVWFEPGGDGHLSTNPLSDRRNLVLDDEDTMANEVRAFATQRGLVVECTSSGMGRRLRALRDIAELVHPQVSLVAGSGWYVDHAVTPAERASDVDELTEGLLLDLAGSTAGIRPGIIGELGTSTPVSSAEMRFLCAGARAQQATGLGVQVHLDGAGREGLRVLECLRDAGADLTRVALSHLDDVMDVDYCTDLLGSGCFVEFDAFGADWQFPDQQVASDDERVDLLAELCSRGWAGQLLLAQDIWLRQRLRSEGGRGFGHLGDSVVPQLLDAGLPADQLTRRNPLRLLTGHDPGERS